MTRFKVFLLFMLIANVVSAQTRQLNGLVTDASNKGVPSATVKVKGSKIQGLTSADGKFTLSVPAGNIVLEISSIGFEPKEVAVATTDNSVSVMMTSTSTALSEVVVTALGIKREKKSLTYATQQVGGDELTKAANSNFMNALSGKVAGVNIATSNSGAGGSTKAVLRGSKSLTGTSEALYVIDGVPLVNNKGSQPGSYGGTDAGDGLSAINPGDIESISVLRGASASILYGSQGANGVILITTKKGKPGKATVSINSSTVFDQVSGLPDFQYKYGSVGGDYSWTPPPSGTPGTALVNAKSPIANIKSDNYQKGYIKDFFRTGVTATNSVSISGGGEKTTAYFSYANTSSTGVMPTNTYGRNQFSFNQSTKLLNDKIVVSSNIMFSSEKSHNRPGAGYYNNPLTGLYLFSRDRDFNKYKQNYSIFDTARNMPKMNWYSTEEKQNNPFWELNSDSKLQTSNRVIADVKISYEIAKNFNFQVRGNIDYNDVILDNRYAADGNSVSVSPNGTWSYTSYTDKALYADGILTYDNTFGNFSLTGLAGVSYQKNNFNDGMNVGNGTTSLRYPNFFSFSNMPSNVIFNKTLNRSLKQGAFGDLTFGFKEFLFLDVSARNDWASTLALTGNQSYLYPSAGLSAIISQMVKLPEVISYFKVRASLTQTANEVPFNVVAPQNSIGSGGTINRNTQVPFTNLKPEKIVASEYGTDLRFLNGRIGLNFTVYKDVSTNQFLTLSAPSGSGYTFYYVNAGKIVNNGFEFTVDADVVRNSNLIWNTAFNGSRNKNKIVELIASNPKYVVGGQDEGFDSRIMAGGSFNDLWIYKFARNNAGQIILDPNTALPTKAQDETKVGNVNPNFLLGWNNNFTYKNFFASVLVDSKFGGVAFSKTEAFLDSYGVSQRTADARDKGSIPINAIMGTTAVTSIDPYTYYQTVGDRNRIMEPYVFSRTNVRLAQLVFGYTFRSQKANPVFKDASVSLIGRNLFFFYKKAPFDPEQAMSTNNSMQSNDVFSMPSTRSIGFNVKFTF
ncbi:SusC/RagA family TonB-linked outer membrane protein [Ginsengibacter hankyongi]|uniref:SusC/RagA family TonB-linked outer membrane protein n=1 Tax=Ginsengibacter hankyongi TaxID=2607284 RepID=A0A5J5IGZ7_9BACT|nr:SusC/RagA family TonB-linked outer membrane protein [Ginsengibacter hankyongi]KAA9039445.1 SusC/RagA family TonB-linked outer membrane protein [Ginsengibacter hankyongi]